MTVASTQSAINYDSSQVSPGVPLPFPYQLYAPQDLLVIINGVPATYNVHYTVAIAPNNVSATVTPLAAMAGLLTNYSGPVTLSREPALVQPIDFSANQKLPERIIEQGFDLSVMRDQVIARKLTEINIPNSAAIAFALSYFGALSSDPSVRPFNNTPLQEGDRYYSIPLHRDRIYIQGIWQNAAISAQELAAAGYRQPGDVFTSGRVTPAPYCVFANGAAYSRTAFPKALAGLTLVASANVASGVQTLQSVSKDLRKLGLEGAPIEIVALGFKSTIVSVTATTVLMATAPGGSAAGAQIQVFPWGNGDGATTFNVPNLCGQTPVGMATMGGAVTGGLTAAWTAAVNGAGGVETVTLTADQLPYIKPGATAVAYSYQDVHSHQVNYFRSNNSNQTTSGAGGVANNGNFETTSHFVSASQPGIYTAVSVNVGGFGNNQPHTVVQPSRAINYFVFMGDPTT